MECVTWYVYPVTHKRRITGSESQKAIQKIKNLIGRSRARRSVIERKRDAFVPADGLGKEHFRCRLHVRAAGNVCHANIPRV